MAEDLPGYRLIPAGRGTQHRSPMAVSLAVEDILKPMSCQISEQPIFYRLMTSFLQKNHDTQQPEEISKHS